jgi:alanyl-tRNA synthetase
MGELDRLLSQRIDIDGIQVVASTLELLDSKGMRELGDRVRDTLRSGVVVLVSATGGRVTWLAMVTKDLTSRVHAGRLAQALAKMTGGGGGGRPDMAEAGGKDPSCIPGALEKLPELIRAQLAG